MPQTQIAPIEVTGFEWVPPFARGHVRDLRVRWALEEVGLDYRTRLINAVDRPEFYFGEQPYGQVPYYVEGDLHLFESGAIALHVAEKGEGLLPPDPAGRARATMWLISALNSIEPYVMNLVVIDLFSTGQEWAKLRRPDAVAALERRLAQLSTALGDKDWLEGSFTVADLIMVDVLRNLREGQLSIPQNLLFYVARGMARPAFQAALAAQMADFLPNPQGEKA